MKIGVTGGNGDMGRSLIPYLLAQNHTVISLDRTLPAERAPGVSFLIADTRDFGQMVASFQGCDALIHLAAIRAPVNHPYPVVYADNTMRSEAHLAARRVMTTSQWMNNTPPIQKIPTVFPNGF